MATFINNCGCKITDDSAEEIEDLTGNAKFLLNDGEDWRKIED